MKPKAFNLVVPITVNEKEVKQLVVQPPRGKHIKKLAPGSSQYDLAIIGIKLAGFTPNVLDEMAGTDVVALGDVVADFLQHGRENG